MADKKLIYMDNAATTAPDPRVVEAMLPYFTTAYGNPSSGYSLGYAAKNAINTARETAAELLGARPEEIYFTGSGTESDNIALESLRLSGKRQLVVSAVEHPAVLKKAEQLEQEGFRVTVIPPDREGFISPEALERYLTPDTGMVSVMLANNEIGTLQPIKLLSEVAHKYGCLFHTDAVQVFGQLPISVDELGVDYLSASAHKLYGPKGVGLLYARYGVPLVGVIRGGGQEYGVRPGTENTAAIAGFGKAIELAALEMRQRAAHEHKLAVHMTRRLLKELKGVCLNGPEVIGTEVNACFDRNRLTELKRLPGNLNFCFEGIRGTSLVIRLDMEKICVSTGAACTAGHDRVSQVLTAIGLSEAEANSSIRITLGKDNTPAEADYVVELIRQTVEELRILNN